MISLAEGCGRRNVKQWPDFRPASRHLVVWQLLLVLSVSLSGLAAARPTPEEKATCRERCDKPCKTNKDGVLECRICKRGWARATSGAPQCNVCARGYGTVINPQLPLAARRGFAACVQEPCGRCSVCPLGTASAGGEPGLVLFQSATCTFARPPPPETIDAGYYWDPDTWQQQLCPQDTFAPNPRPRDHALIDSCMVCSSLYSLRDLSFTGVLQALVATGKDNRKSCSCPGGTFYQEELLSNMTTASWACVTCPLGSSGGDSGGAVGAADCRRGCQAGYWGDPSDPAYSHECSKCPMAAGSSAFSSTGIWVSAPVPLTDCRDCVWTATESSAAAEPAACSACPVGYSRDAGGACKNCAAGYYLVTATVLNGTCQKCEEAKYAANYEATSAGVPHSTTCGGCQAGLYGDTCNRKCSAAGKKPRDAVDSEAWVLLARSLKTVDNCLWGCPPGTGWDASAKSCNPCQGQTYSTGATPGAPRRPCMNCPPGSVAERVAGFQKLAPPAGNTQCAAAAAAAASLAAMSLFDEFD